MDKQIADHFFEAAEILQKFNTTENFQKLTDAGKLMVEAIANKGKNDSNSHYEYNHSNN